MSHGTFAAMDADRNLPVIPGRKNMSITLWDFPEGEKYFSCFPPFHVSTICAIESRHLMAAAQLGGFMSLITIPLLSKHASPVLGPPHLPPSGSLISEIMEHQKLRAIFCPPLIVEQLMQEPKAFDQMRQLEFILYAGGPLTSSTGDAISKITNLGSSYGATETRAITGLFPLQDDWAYLEWHPAYAVDMQPAIDGTYELVLHKDSHEDGALPVFEAFPDIQIWRTGDLFKPHPSKADLWSFYGRTDDIIVMSNSFNFNPSPMEQIVQNDPNLTGALIFGQGKAQAALLVEPRADIDYQSLITRIWPTIEKANAQGPGQARIIRSMVLIASPGKRFVRAPKGSVVRKLTIDLYAPDLENLYSQELTPDKQTGPVLTATDSLETIREFVSSQVQYCFPFHTMEPTNDFYVYGLDSVKTVELIGLLKAGMKGGGITSDLSWPSNKLIYANSTIEKLSQAIFHQLNSSAIPNQSSCNLEEERIGRMTALVKKYTEGLPSRNLEKQSRPRRSNLYVLIVGSTGSIGTWLLQHLLRSSSVEKVICLDRSADAKIRHQDIVTQRELDIDLDSPKVEFLLSDLRSSRFGLSETKFDSISLQVDFIVYNAWTVNFNHHLESFEHVHLRGLRNVIDLCLSHPQNPHLFFVSSIASVFRWTTIQGSTTPMPEAPISNSSLAADIGYAESKNVAEQILDIAHSHSGLSRSILRLGNIAGPLHLGYGSWNEREWFPSLLKTSKAVSKLPDHIPAVDYIPVDLLSKIILEIVLQSLSTDAHDVYNLVNPYQTKWSELLEPIRKAMGDGCKVVSVAEWIKTVEGEGHDSEDLNVMSEKPTLKVLEFTKAALLAESQLYETSNGKAASETFARLGPVTKEWMEIWLKQWGY